MRRVGRRSRRKTGDRNRDQQSRNHEYAKKFLHVRCSSQYILLVHIAIAADCYSKILHGLGEYTTNSPLRFTKIARVTPVNCPPFPCLLLGRQNTFLAACVRPLNTVYMKFLGTSIAFGKKICPYMPRLHVHYNEETEIGEGELCQFPVCIGGEILHLGAVGQANLLACAPCSPPRRGCSAAERVSISFLL